MAITEERSRRRQKHSQTSASTDRISELPDSILCHILSFLPTKSYVATSVLSRRWRYLWAYVPKLDFRGENHEIINSVLLLRKVQNIATFRLFYGTEFSDYQLQTWVTFACSRNVQTLDLCFHSQIALALPRCLFTCTTLVALRLRSRSVIPASGAVCLPRLKKLHLLRVKYEADESLPHLLSGCPVIEELLIQSHKNMAYCNVSSPTMKRLVLNFTSNGRTDRLLEINTPALEHLTLRDSFSEHIKCGMLTSLTKADIILVNDKNKPDYFLCSRSLLKFIHRFCKVKSLNLVLSYCPKIVDSLFYAWSTSFRRITKLELTADARFLSKFLEKSDNLEILVFSEFSGEIQVWREPQQVPECLLSHLRIIKLGNIKGQKHEFEYIKYLLWNAKVLKRMEISYPGSLASEEKIRLLHEISQFQRGSTACQVVFVGDVK